MASLAKTKVIYGVKSRRGSQSSISVDRTELGVQEIPPELCHLSSDALATPFPPIAVGGYIKYYKMYSGPVPHHSLQPQEQEMELKDYLKEMKQKRRASSASTLLGPLLSHTPKPWPSKEVPTKSRLFWHTRSKSSPSTSSGSISPPSSPKSTLKRSLAVIPEASRETMHTDFNPNYTFPTTPRKTRVASYPSAMPPTKTSSLTASALALDFVKAPHPLPCSSSSLVKSDSIKSTASSASSAPASPTGSLLRRRKRQLLRTPSVENDFSKCARELMGLTQRDGSGEVISRETSSGSGMTEEDGGLQNTTATSLLFELFSSPEKAASHDAPSHSHLIPLAKSDTSHSTELEDLSEAESNGSTAPTSVGCISFDDIDEDEKRDSWASYQTAQSLSVEELLRMTIVGVESLVSA